MYPLTLACFSVAHGPTSSMIRPSTGSMNDPLLARCPMPPRIGPAYRPAADLSRAVTNTVVANVVFDVARLKESVGALRLALSGLPDRLSVEPDGILNLVGRERNCAWTECPLWVKRVGSAISASRPLIPQSRPMRGHYGSVVQCHNETHVSQQTSRPVAACAQRPVRMRRVLGMRPVNYQTVMNICRTNPN